MATINNGESGSSVRTKLNDIINKVEGVTSINNDIDVTGTVTADGLTVDGAISQAVTAGTVPIVIDTNITSTEGSVDIIEAKTVNNEKSTITLDRIGSTNTGLTFKTTNASTLAQRLKISNEGDISFYEDTGTTPKMVWSASAEELIVGSSTGAGGAGLTITSSSGDAIGYVLARGANGLTTQHRYLNRSSGGANTGGAIGHIGDTGLVLTGSTTSIDGAQDVVIDASGNLLVGKTSADSGATAGIETSNNGRFNATRDGSISGVFNRLTSDGDIVEFRKDGTTVGSIGATSGNLFINSEGTGGYGRLQTQGTDKFIWYSASFYPATDNSLDLGTSSFRYDDVYATNALIQTSDRNEKQDIAEMDEAERRVAVAAKGLLRKFRWKDAVAEKGDDARIHFGIIAQDLQAAFAAEGLDAGKYAMFIHSTWTDEETGEERSRMGVRYSELLAFIIAAI